MRPLRRRTTSRAPPALSILLLSLAASATATTPTLPPPTLLLHLSDLHFASPPRPHTLGDAGADLGALGSALRHAHPAALLITGDLTHAKAPHGGSRQAQPEWRAYRRAVNALAAGLGWDDTRVSADRLLDLRGNHDAFAVPARGGPADEFPSWAGEGRRAPAARVVVSAASVEAGVARVGDGAYGGACPAACLVGVDVTPTPGPAGANNFAGWVGGDASLDAALRAGAAQCVDDHAAACAAAGLPRPAVLAYGHYPLATVARPLPRAGGARPPSLAASLAAAGASTYLAGHLHAVFGDRLHRLIEGGDGTGDGDAHATPLAEVVAAAWATERALRLVAVDGGVTSFLDLRMRGGPGEATGVAAAHRPPPFSLAFEGVGAGVGGAPGEGAAVVGRHALLITSPGDARYGAGPVAPGHTLLRVLAIPVCASPDPEAPCRPDPPPGGLTAALTCRPSGAMPPPLALARPDEAAAPHLWQGVWPADDSLCPAGDGSVEVRVTSGDWASASPTVVAWLRRPSGAPEVPPPRPPLTTTRLAAWAVAVDWQAAARTSFYGLWAAHFCGALLAPRMAGGASAAAGLEAAALRAPGGRPGRALAAWLVWPAASLCASAGATGPWLAQTLYALLLLAGPWGVVAPFGPAAPGVRALYGPAGFTRLGGGGPAGGAPAPSLYVPDAARVGALHLVGAVAPCTAWVAASAAAVGRARRARAPGLSLATRAGLVAGGAASAASCAAFAYRFAWQLGGWTAIAASPGLTWTWFLAAALVGWVVVRRGQ